MQADITAPIINVELFTWMKRITAQNDHKDYYMIGQVAGRINTLLVTLVNGNGGAVMYCQTHGFVYPLKGKCAGCLNAPHEAPIDATATTCSTPDFER